MLGVTSILIMLADMDHIRSYSDPEPLDLYLDISKVYQKLKKKSSLMV